MIRLVRVLKHILPPCPHRLSASTWLQDDTDIFSLTPILSLPGSSPFEIVPTFLTCLSSAHISARALPGACGRKPCANCAFPATMEGLRSYEAFSRYRCI